MGRSLVIVESPAKAKTINKYLGSDFIVKSSVGHIRDLPTGGTGNPDPKARAAEAATRNVGESDSQKRAQLEHEKTDGRTDRPAGRQADKQMDRQADRQADR